MGEKYNKIISMQNWKLQLNSKPDPVLFKQFPVDQYGDIIIKTANYQFQLSSSYLALQSHFFSLAQHNKPNLQQKTFIDLSSWTEQPLISVLKGLYGGEVEVKSVTELTEVMEIVEKLGVDDFKVNLVNQLLNLHRSKGENTPFNNFELIQFCLNKNILKKQIIQFHITSQLKILESTKSYLQLGKLSPPTLNHILLTFLQSKGEPAEPVISRILWNYFNRLSIKPIDYFTSDSINALKQIWQKYHNKLIKKISPDRPPLLLSHKSESIIMNNSSIFNNSQSHFFKSQKMDPLTLANKKIQIMQKQLKQKDIRIKNLQDQLARMKKGSNYSPIAQGTIKQSIIQKIAKKRKSRERLNYEPGCEPDNTFGRIKQEKSRNKSRSRSPQAKKSSLLN